MTMHRITNLALAALIALLLSCSYLLDLPSDLQEITDGAMALQDAQQAASAAVRFDRAARQICGGENAQFDILADGAVQCRTKRGRKTIQIAQVTP
jgi:hypothetical protein